VRTRQNAQIPELKGFSRVELAAGETRHVTISLDARAFAFYDVAGKLTLGTSRS
jgi:beta-glucosidase